MFRTSITSTPFTSSTANGCFPNINGRPFSNDISFLATLRALVAPRIPADEEIYLFFGSSSYGAGVVKDNSARDIMGAICGDYDLETTGRLFIHNLRGVQDDIKANFKVIDETFCAVYPGYHRLDKVKEFYKKSFDVDCYINPEIKSTIVFVDNIDNRKLHYLEVSILAFFPWYFKPEDGLAEDEFALIKSLRENKPDSYNACIAKLAEKYDFRTARIKQLLSGFETRYERIELERVQESIRAIERDINNLNQRIGTYLTDRNEKSIRMMGLQQKIASGDGENSEIMDYFLCNKKLILEEVSDTDMFFAVKDYYEFFDRDVAETIIANRNSYVYYGYSQRDGMDCDKMERLLHEMFVNDCPRLRMRVCAAYRFDLNGSVQGMSSHAFGTEFVGYMPNPHINRYSCMGNYQRIINELLMQHDYIGALEQCVASCKSLNWNDSTVMEAFMDTLWKGGETNRCIELPNGKVVKPYEAVKWLEEQDGNSHDTENENAARADEQQPEPDEDEEPLF